MISAVCLFVYKSPPAGVATEIKHVSFQSVILERLMPRHR